MDSSGHFSSGSETSTLSNNFVYKLENMDKNSARDLRPPQSLLATLRPSASVFVPISKPKTIGFLKNLPPVLDLPPCSCYLYSTSCTHFCTLYLNLPLSIPTDLEQPSKPMIRLIYLKPGRENDPIECVLFCVSLQVPTKFKALSYVWGDTSTRRIITVNGRLVNITNNLYTALKNLRKPLAAIVLWVDALCIDQTNLPERGSQVAQMPNIYSAAEEVVAWLGEAENNSDLAMSYIADHGGRKKPTAERCKDLTVDIENALAYLWSRPYWSRVWVVQELASAWRSRKTCLFQCGSRSVSYNVMRKFLGIFLKKIFVTRHDQVLDPRRMITLSSSSSRMPILEVLWDSALLQSSDPRDRIYGIRGITPQYYRDTIKVDYSLDFHMLCWKFMEYHIKKEKSLDILCCFHQFPLIDSYPSWLCDLRNRTSGISPFHYSCSGSRNAIASISRGFLTAKGLCIGVVKDIRGPYHIPFAGSPTLLTEQAPDIALGLAGVELEELERLAFEALKTRYSSDGSPGLESRFFDMVAGNRQYEAGSSPTSKSLAACRELWNKYITAMKLGKLPWEDYHRFSLMFERLIGRCFFTTFDNQVGLGPQSIQSGDAVCIIYGCSLCAILRPCGISYLLVGTAYVDGAMSGEYLGGVNEENRVMENDFSMQ